MRPLAIIAVLLLSTPAVAQDAFWVGATLCDSDDRDDCTSVRIRVPLGRYERPDGWCEREALTKATQLTFGFTPTAAAVLRPETVTCERA